MISNSPQQTYKIAADIAEKIKKGGVLLLYGDLGSGKTTFVKGLAQALGLKDFHIKSPTYTYIRHLSLPKRNFYHVDLYRLDEVDELLVQEIKELMNNNKNIVVIEWAERLADEISIPNAFKIDFRYLNDSSREIIIGKSLPEKYLDEAQIAKIYAEFRVPKQIIGHMEKVAYISAKICDLFLKNGIDVDKRAVTDSALVHDCIRVCDIRNFNPQTLTKNPKPRDVMLWLDLRKKYSKIGHEKAMANYLQKGGYAYLANLVAKHGFFDVWNLESYEEKILYYADKRVDKDRIVSLKVRFSEGRKRNLDPKSDQNLVRKSEKEVFKLEKQLSKLLGQNIDKL